MTTSSRKTVKEPSAQHQRCRALLKTLLNAQRSKLIISTMGVQSRWKTAMWDVNSVGATPVEGASAMSDWRGVDHDAAGASAGHARRCRCSNCRLRGDAPTGAVPESHGAEAASGCTATTARSPVAAECAISAAGARDAPLSNLSAAVRCPSTSRAVAVRVPAARSARARAVRSAAVHQDAPVVITYPVVSSRDTAGGGPCRGSPGAALMRLPRQGWLRSTRPGPLDPA